MKHQKKVKSSKKRRLPPEPPPRKKPTFDQICCILWNMAKSHHIPVSEVGKNLRSGAWKHRDLEPRDVKKYMIRSVAQGITRFDSLEQLQDIEIEPGRFLAVTKEGSEYGTTKLVWIIWRWADDVGFEACGRVMRCSWKKYQRIMNDPIYNEASEEFNPKREVSIPVEFTRPQEKPGKAIRGKLYGYPVTAVIRWMGVEGFDTERARFALDSLGADVADATITAQLRAGRKGERGEPANLTDDQANAVYEASEPPRG